MMQLPNYSTPVAAYFYCKLKIDRIAGIK